MKRLAIFLDDTWNTLNNNTSVWRLKSLTTQSADQFVYYGRASGHSVASPPAAASQATASMRKSLMRTHG
jgi:hypothetical protein